MGCPAPAGRIPCSLRFFAPWSSIAFVTHRDGGSYDIHIFNLNTDLDTVVASSEPFGAYLAQRGECYLRSADKTVAVFVEKHFKAADTVILINRESRSLRRVR